MTTSSLDAANRELSIAFAPRDVRTILEGNKTQERRLAVNQHGNKTLLSQIPVGAMLWVKEAFRFAGVESGGPMRVLYLADAPRGTSDLWLKAHEMPRWASRVTLELTGVDLHLLQDMKDEDALAEGYWPTHRDGRTVTGLEKYILAWGHRYNNAEHAAWAKNPLVVALAFKAHKVNISALAAA